MAVVGDAASSSDVRPVLDEVKRHGDGLDILIACAGGHGFAKATDTHDADWELSITANLTTAFVAAHGSPAAFVRGPRQHTDGFLYCRACRRTWGLWLYDEQTCHDRAHPIAGARLWPGRGTGERHLSAGSVPPWPTR